MYDPYLHLANMDVTNKEEINQVLPWSTDLPSTMQGTDKKGSKQKVALKTQFLSCVWGYLTLRFCGPNVTLGDNLRLFYMLFCTSNFKTQLSSQEKISRVIKIV